MTVELPEDYRELVSLYLATRAAELQALSEALASGDLAAAVRVGHNLQGSSRSFGFDEADAIGRELEAAGRAADAPAVARLAGRLGRYLDRVEVTFVAPPRAPDHG